MLKIIFENFWTWAGTVILLGTLLSGIVDVIKAARRPDTPQRKVSRYTFKDGTENLSVEGVSETELKEIVRNFVQGDVILREDEKGDGEK